MRHVQSICTLAVAAFGLAVMSGCTIATNGAPAGPAGPPTSKTVAVTPFTAVEVSAGVDVAFSPGAPSAVLTGDERYFDRITVTQKGETLSIGRRTQGLMEAWNDPVTVALTGPAALTRIAASSGADINATAVAAADLSVSASSGAVVRVSGTCAALDADASSGASVQASALQCADATGAASSGGQTHMFAATTARARASSGGAVRVHGPASLVERSESSGGSVSTMN